MNQTILLLAVAGAAAWYFLKGPGTSSTATGVPPPGSTVGTQQPSFAYGFTRGLLQIDPASTPLLPGDTFMVSVSGTPNTQVSVTRSDGATANLGTTDASGYFVYKGTITAGYPAGTFVEKWFVGSMQVGQYTFSIPAATISGLGLIGQRAGWV